MMMTMTTLISGELVATLRSTTRFEPSVVDSMLSRGNDRKPTLLATHKEAECFGNGREA